MKHRYLILLGLLLFINFSCAQQENSTTQQPKDTPTEKQTSFQSVPFVLGVGDEVNITVWNNTDLTSTVKISPEGNIHLPFLNEIKAEGLTIHQLKQEITEQLSHYIRNPIVGVNIENLVSQKVHVLGEVGSPGTVLLESRMLIWEAIAQTGGFSEYANTKRVLLLRREKAKVTISAFDMEVTSQNNVKNSGYNTYLKGNDILYVAPTKLTKVARFMNQFNEIIGPLLNLQAGVVLWPQFVEVLEGKSSDQKTLIVNPN